MPAHDVLHEATDMTLAIRHDSFTLLLSAAPRVLLQAQQFMPDLRDLQGRLAPESRIDLHVRNKHPLLSPLRSLFSTCAALAIFVPSQ